MPSPRDIRSYKVNGEWVDIERTRLTLPPMDKQTREAARELMKINEQLETINKEVKEAQELFQSLTQSLRVSRDVQKHLKDDHLAQLVKWEKKVKEQNSLLERKKPVALALKKRRIKELFPSLSEHDASAEFGRYENTLWILTDTIFNTGKDRQQQISRDIHDPLSFDLLYYGGSLILYNTVNEQNQVQRHIGYSVLAEATVNYLHDPVTNTRRLMTDEELERCHSYDSRKMVKVLKMGPLGFLKEYQNLGLTQKDCLSALLNLWWGNKRFFRKDIYEAVYVNSSCANPISFDLVTMASSTLPRKGISKDNISPEDQEKFDTFCKAIYPFPDHQYTLGDATRTRWTPSQHFAAQGNEETADMRWYRTLVQRAKEKESHSDPFRGKHGYTVYTMSSVSMWQVVLVAVQVLIKFVKRLFKPKIQKQDLTVQSPSSTLSKESLEVLAWYRHYQQEEARKALAMEAVAAAGKREVEDVTLDSHQDESLTYGSRSIV